MSRELLQQALKLLIAYQDYTRDSRIANKCGLTIQALEAELAKPVNEFNPDWDQQAVLVERIRELEAELAKPEQAEKQEHQFKYTPYGLRADELGNLSIGELPRKEWVGLTDKEILDLWVANHKNTGATDAFACAVEAKLKEKNT